VSKNAKEVIHAVWVLYHPHIGRGGSVWSEIFLTRKAALAARKRPRLEKWVPNPRHGFPAVGQPVRVFLGFQKIKGKWRAQL